MCPSIAMGLLTGTEHKRALSLTNCSPSLQKLHVVRQRRQKRPQKPAVMQMAAAAGRRKDCAAADETQMEPSRTLWITAQNCFIRRASPYCQAQTTTPQ